MLSGFFRTSPFAIGIDAEACLDAIRIIMQHNIFRFGASFWVQRNGTAMGTPPAPAYAQLYFLIHELTFVHTYVQLRYYVRYLDDIFLVCDPDPNPVKDEADWTDFQTCVNAFRNLRWNLDKCARCVSFLDLEIQLDSAGLLSTNIYEKALNLYLYLPPHSSHSPGVLRSSINGFAYRAFPLCMHDNSREIYLR